jgi:hypothetical protein
MCKHACSLAQDCQEVVDVLMPRCCRSDLQQQLSDQAAAVVVPSFPLQRHAHGQLASAESAALTAALPFASARSAHEVERTRRLVSAPAQFGDALLRDGDENKDADTFCSVAQVRLAFKKRMREMEAAQKRMHLSKVRHTTKRSQTQLQRHAQDRFERPLSELEEESQKAAPGVDEKPAHVTFDGLSFRKYSVDLEYRNTITRSCRSALMQGSTVVLRAPLSENDEDLRECRMVLQSVYMQVSALTRADIVPEAVADPQGACTTMTLQPKR